MSQELVAALQAEYAAIYAYGPIGVRLSDANERAARDAEAAHRARRDTLVMQLSTAGAEVPTGAAGYTLPYAVTDRATALKLAIEVEQRTAAFWRAVLPVTEGAQRTQALNALTDCAVRATRWRKAANVTPLTVTFPGRPG